MGMDVINQAIDRDLKAQEFAYNAAKDTAVAKQTAFGMAMQKYQNADQARAMARAAALDAVQAQLGQQAAMWKGTEAANRANIAMADLEAQKRNEIQQGIAFTPTHQVAVGATYVDPTTGLRYNENQAHDLAKEYRGYGEKLGEINAKGTQDAYLKAIEAAMKQSEEKTKGARTKRRAWPRRFSKPVSRNRGLLRNELDRRLSTIRSLLPSVPCRSPGSELKIPCSIKACSARTN